MEFVKHCIIFIGFFCVFDWIIKKTDIRNKIFDNPRSRKFIKYILVLLLVIFMFYLGYVKYDLQERYGKFGFISIVEASFLASINVNFMQFVWRGNKKK